MGSSWQTSCNKHAESFPTSKQMVVIGKFCRGAIVLHLQHPFYAYSSTWRAKCNSPIIRKATAHCRSQQKSTTTFDHGGYLCHLGPRHPKKKSTFTSFVHFCCKIPLQNCTCIIIIYYNFILYIIIRLFEPFSQLKLLHSSGIFKPNRKRHRQFRCFNPLLGGVFFVIEVSADNPNLDMAKKHVRQGERLMRQLRSCPEPFKENKHLACGEYVFCFWNS